MNSWESEDEDKQDDTPQDIDDLFKDRKRTFQRRLDFEKADSNLGKFYFKESGDHFDDLNKFLLNSLNFWN